MQRKDGIHINDVIGFILFLYRII